MAFTAVQAELIKTCKALGYGYARFASSVESQGWCSTKQEECLVKLRAVGTARKLAWNNAPTPRYRDVYFIDREEGGEF